MTINLAARKVVTEDKTETFQPADKAKPGEVIQYDATCRNSLPRAVKDVKPVVPVPKGSVFVDGSAKPAQFEASLDGHTFAKPPLTREVKQPDGSLKKEPVPATEYRALRWNLPELAAGAAIHRHRPREGQHECREIIYPNQTKPTAPPNHPIRHD